MALNPYRCQTTASVQPTYMTSWSNEHVCERKWKKKKKDKLTQMPEPVIQIDRHTWI